MASDLKPTTRAERAAWAEKDAIAMAGLGAGNERLRLIADIERADAILKRVEEWYTQHGYMALFAIQADAKRLREAWK